MPRAWMIRLTSAVVALGTLLLLTPLLLPHQAPATGVAVQTPVSPVPFEQSGSTTLSMDVSAVSVRTAAAHATGVPTATATSRLQPPLAVVPDAAQMTARLVAHLQCRAPLTIHDPARDAVAVPLLTGVPALPPHGMVRLPLAHGMRLLLAPDVLAALQNTTVRCGDTLIFGLPPLTWLPDGTHWGIVYQPVADGGIVAIVTATSEATP